MKKYSYHLIFLLLSAAVLASCYADKGNYTYIGDDEVMPVEIADLRDTTVLLYSTLNLEPQVKGLGNREDYQYAWYKTNGDTLSKEFGIYDLMIDLDLGDHRIYYSIKNKRNDVAVFATFTMKVDVSFNNGWYLLIDHDGQTDLDFVFNSDGAVDSDILYKANGFRLQGAPVKIVNQKSGYGYTFQDENGEPLPKTGLTALHIMSSDDFVSLDPITMKKYYRGEETFLFPPEKIAPGNWRYDNFYSIFGISMVNDGKLYTIYMSNDYLSRFGYPVGYREEYHAWGDYLYGVFSGIVVFDTVEERFLFTAHGGENFTAFPDRGEVPSPHDMNHRMVEFLSRSNESQGTATAYALMQDNQSGNTRIFSIGFNSINSDLFDGIFDIPAGSKLMSAPYKAAHITSSGIYFSEGDNILYIHNLASSNDLAVRESKILEFPSNEKIVFLNQEKTSRGVPVSLVIVTQNGNKWKLYEYNIVGSTVELEKQAATVLEGEGKVGYALKVD